jgi:hypothetical protein
MVTRLRVLLQPIALFVAAIALSLRFVYTIRLVVARLATNKDVPKARGGSALGQSREICLVILSKIKIIMIKDTTTLVVVIVALDTYGFGLQCSSRHSALSCVLVQDLRNQTR